MRRRPSHARGFTIIELMTVVAVLAIVAAIAAPSFSSFIGTMNTKSAAFDLISDLSYARSEAIKQNTNTTITPVSGTNWASGWRVTLGATTLRERPALTSSIAVSGAPGAITFLPNGRLGADTAAANQAWRVESTIAGVTARCVVVTLTGAARSKYGAC